MSTAPEPTSVIRSQGRVVQFYDGAGNWLTLTMVQDQFVAAYDGVTDVEAMSRNEHLANPISMRTAAGKITGSVSFLASKMYCSSTSEMIQNPWTWLAWQRAQAAGLTPTTPTSMAIGGSWAFGIRVYDESSNSTETYKFVRPEKPTMSWENELLKVTFNFTDLEEVSTTTTGNGLSS